MPPTAAASGGSARRGGASGPPGNVASKTSLAASAKKKTIPTSFTQKWIIRFLVEKGARLDARNTLGWTPLMVTQGMLIAANARFYPLTEALIKQLMMERGMDPAKYSQRRALKSR